MPGRSVAETRPAPFARPARGTDKTQDWNSLLSTLSTPRMNKYRLLIDHTFSSGSSNVDIYDPEF